MLDYYDLSLIVALININDLVFQYFNGNIVFYFWIYENGYF